MGPIKSSGLQLKAMLKKTGRSLKGFEGAEKLDLLYGLTDQIKEKIGLGQKMLLTLAELNAFLEVEGLAPGEDAAGTIRLLLELRQAQLARLGGYVACRNPNGDLLCESDQSFSLALVELPGHKVSNCFSCDPLEHAKAQVKHTDNPGAITERMDAVPAEAHGNGSDIVDARLPCHVDVLPIKSSATELKTLLQKTGRSTKYLGGAEKLDILNMITDQVKEKVQLKQKMMLSLSDLNFFIEHEGLPPGEGAKGAIESLLELRQKQLLRLARYTTVGNEAGPQCCSDVEADTSFRLALMIIPMETVRECFSDSLAKIPTETACEIFDDTKQFFSRFGNDASHTVSEEVSTRKRPCSDDMGTSTEDVARPMSVPRLGGTFACGNAVVVSESLDTNQEDNGASSMSTDDLFTAGSVEAELSFELKVLLAEQMSKSDIVHALEFVLLSSESQQENEGELSDLPLRQAAAAREVDRILDTKEVGDILGAGSLEDQRQQFQRIARLLHPDKGYVPADDTRANMALRLALVARRRAGAD